ncbi:hypothetical protein G7Y89_g13343 [Cudoniella acicularis]|uniref:Uncharacterized protein n=1 Tax=Cudoniella acicularis TaxID=354080 RepID=A0A8H4R735_9HELO|nr:hypothetical protein G7Y89_g13343 [Cudoniella acicularis]
MSFGFGAGDFLAAGSLALRLYRSFKDAPGEFNELRRELSSLCVIVQDLTDQAGSERSLLNRRGASRRDELLLLLENLTGTLVEIRELYKRFRNMGRNAWLRIRLGETDLTALRTKLALHIGLINQFISSLTLESVGRMEPMMGEILRILHRTARGYGIGAQSLLGTQASALEGEGFGPLEAELVSEGIPIKYIRNHRDDIQTILDEVIEEEGLEEVDNILPDDSASQTTRPSPGASSRPNPRRPQTDSDQKSSHSFSVKQELPIRSKHFILGDASGKQIMDACRHLKKYGFDYDKADLKSNNKGRGTSRAEARAALCVAAFRCDELAVRCVIWKGIKLKHPVDVNKGRDHSTTAIHEAIKGPAADEPTMSMIRLLLQFGGDVTQDEEIGGGTNIWGMKEESVSNLYQAAEVGKLSVVRFLLDEGALVNQVCGEDRGTALSAAARGLHHSIVKLLLEMGASVNLGRVIRSGELKEGLEEKGYSCKRTPLNDCYQEKGRGSETERLLLAAGGVHNLPEDLKDVLGKKQQRGGSYKGVNLKPETESDSDSFIDEADSELINKTCYAPDGITEADGPQSDGWLNTAGIYKPCISIYGIDSMCCKTNVTDDTIDTCMPNGLCLSRGSWYRDYCTDPTWESPNCLPKTMCSDSQATGTAQVTNCPDGTFCCGDPSAECCNNGAVKYTLLPTLVQFATASTATFSNSTMSTTTPISSTSPASSSSPDTFKVGMSVGFSLGVLAIVGSMVGFWLGQRRGRHIAAQDVQLGTMDYRRDAYMMHETRVPTAELATER